LGPTVSLLNRGPHCQSSLIWPDANNYTQDGYSVHDCTPSSSI